MKLVLLMLKNLRRNLVRTVLTCLAIFVLVFVVTMIWSFLHMLDSYTTAKAGEQKGLIMEKWQFPSMLPWKLFRCTPRGGHIPTAASIPWARAAAEDGTYKNRTDLEALYLGEASLKPGDDVIAYCRIGERSSHTWFVLQHLLGFGHVRNYDGSWTEWGNSVRVPITRGTSP